MDTNAVNEANELADWLGNHAQHLQRMEAMGAMPESELTPRIARAAELLRQLAPASAPADEGAPISLYEPRHSPQPAILAAPSNERPWERPGWCNEACQCWMGNPGGNGFSPTWQLAKVNNYQAADLWQLSGFLWSLPHWAIPIIPSTANPAP